MGNGQKIGIFSSLAGPAAARRLGTGHAVGAHVAAGVECANATEAGADADGLTQPSVPHTRSLRTASSGNPHSI